MIIKTEYLSDDSAVKNLLKYTELALDELEAIVGRFRQDHHAFPNALKGEVVYHIDGSLKIRHHFTKKTLWECE
jgi:hypothetical protein